MLTMYMLSIQNANASSFIFPSEPIPITGPQKLLVILVQFPDVIHDPNYDVATILDNYKEYIKKNSYGKMWWEIDVSPTWYTMPFDLSTYNNDLGLQTKIFQHAADAASKDFDLSKYDKILIIYATPRSSSTIPPPNYPYNFQYFNGYIPIKVNNEDHYIWVTAVVDADALGTPAIFLMTHEFGHGGLQLPDLYSPAFTGPWDPMSGTIGNTPLGFCSWTKLKLGWLEQKNIFTVLDGRKETVKIDALGLDSTGILAIKIPVTDKRYFLIEVREPVGVDSPLATIQGGTFISDRQFASGVFVLEINENLISRTGIIKWINSQTQQPAAGQIETESAAFLVGESFSNPYFGKMTVKLKSGNTYEVEIDRTSTQPFVERDFVIKTDKSIYTTGDTLIFTGKVPEVITGADVWIDAYAPSGKDYRVGDGYPSSDGTFSIKDLSLYDFMVESGVWKVEAHYANWVKEFSFEVNPKQTDQKQEVSKVTEQKTPIVVDIEIKTDKSTYTTGDTVIFTGKVSKVIPDQILLIIMHAPSGKLNGAWGYPSSDGSFNIKGILYDIIAEPGVWKVEAQHGDMIAKVQISFEVNNQQSTLPQKVIKTEQKIPQWVRNNAKLWSEGSVVDGDFIHGIQYLVTHGVIKLPENKAGSVTSKDIPAWIRNNAKWWSDGQITDDDFISGIQYLISNGILKV